MFHVANPNQVMKPNKPFFASLLLTAALALPGAAQLTPTTLHYCLTNGVNYVGHVTTTNLVTQPATLAQGKGCSISVVLCGTNAACTTNVCLHFQVSVDGTNYNNNPLDTIKHWVTPNGVTAVYSYTNLAPALLNNARYLKLATVTNANLALAGGWFLTNVIVGTH
jgi:hypothetical protein